VVEWKRGGAGSYMSANLGRRPTESRDAPHLRRAVARSVMRTRKLNRQDAADAKMPEK
jgi:hypothetical protein